MKVSVIIPTRNRPDYLPEAVASVLTQDHSLLELLIVNDGEVPLPAFADTRVICLNSGQAGAVVARNMGVEHATGELIAWLDDDDAWTDIHFLTRAIAAVQAGADFVFGDGDLVFPAGARKRFAQDADAQSLERDNTILISAVCYQRKLHGSLGLFDEALAYYWDWDWYLRVARAGCKLQRLATPVVDIRVHANNMSGKANAEAREVNLAAFSTKHNLPKIPLKAHVDFV